MMADLVRAPWIGLWADNSGQTVNRNLAWVT